MKIGSFATLLIVQSLLPAAEGRPLFNGKNLEGWEIQGESIWTVCKNGTLVGQRDYRHNDSPFHGWPITEAVYSEWMYAQSWLYTKADFEEYDLHLEYWLPPGGNSGVSIRDISRGVHSFGSEPRKTPAHIGYEIQLIDSRADEQFRTGSVYLLAPAVGGVQYKGDWNTLDIESRRDMIRVSLNGRLVTNYPGDPARPLRGPIGLQLHDRFTWVMFRNIRIQEYGVHPGGR
jgi:hypothetical protein